MKAMTPAALANAPLTRMTPEQRDAQLINRVYGNISLENPKVTREFVAEHLRPRRQAEAANGTNP